MKRNLSQYYKNMPPPAPKAALEYFFNDQKEGKPYDDIEEGKKRVTGMLNSFINMIMKKDDEATHQYRGNPTNVNIPITSELYDRVRFSGYNYQKLDTGCAVQINGNIEIEVSNADITKEDVDIIVNVTNSLVNHDEGLAKKIRKAGAGKVV